ncbi:arf-GAP with Rho-GAP domain, ANK repeat and PH domain-containing protein 1 [Tiliqua scincoides]|uniref:arf-GAP with Rho-GAP domain, ANK repeat and PH domain-containing protein 1 n=1 Tax=Tiliqua scincoides TaxID=71010 RepID=UPI003461FD7C
MAEGASLPMAEWLRALHLDQYIENFERHELNCVSDCQHLTDEALTHLGVLLPGHRKRILSGLLKAFTEALPAMEGPKLPPRRPVPMRRHIFRASSGTAASPEEQEAKSDCVATAGEKQPPQWESEPTATGLHPVPPPIPPRVGCRPPVKFSSSAVSEAPVVPSCESASLLDFTSPLPSLQLTGERLSPNTSCLEEMVKPPLPPLPAKRHQPESKALSQRGPPVPSRPPELPPRVGPQKVTASLPVKDESQGPEEPAEVCGALFPCPKSLDLHGTAKEPSKPTLFLQPAFDDSDYEDPLFDEETDVPREEMSDQEEATPTTRHSMRFSSLFSEDELIEDYYKEEPPPLNHHWHDATPCPSTFLSSGYSDSMDRSNSVTQPSLVIKAGWLDKNPPQGSYIYQKRWVKLDTDYLRYFDGEKDIYSKRLIPVSSITRVASIGDQKFEVITNNRTFAFRAESDVDRNEWIKALQSTVNRRKSRASVFHVPGNSFDSVDKGGLLELRGFKNKLYVVVAGEKVFLYKNPEDFRLGIGITYIEMNVGNVKDVDRRGFDLTTPYRIFSFLAESDQEKEEWVEAMQQSVAEALSNFEVAERIWSVEENCFCADCGSPKPDWGSINLCVVICKRCAGEHRGLGPKVTKVRSLKMDKKVWTEELIELFLQIGNAVANQFWAANVPPSESINAWSGSQERRRFLVAKYREGKYRRYHQLFGNQEELNKALCAAVTTSDLAETLSLLFCGAEVNCYSEDPNYPSPITLAEQAGQRLQVEFLLQNKTSETPQLDMGTTVEKHYSIVLPSVAHNGFLYKAASMAKLVNERKSREEFSRRWCRLHDGVFSYYETNTSTMPNGEIKMHEVACVVHNPPDAHGFVSTFEVYTESERLYLFGLDSPEAIKEWVTCIAKSFLHPSAEGLLSHDFQRLGRLQYKGGLNLEQPKVGWFALVRSTLYANLEGKEETIHLRKLQELSTQGDNEVLVLVERRRTLYIQGERKLDFLGWVSAIQKAAGSSGDTLSEQQLTEMDVPIIVDRCVDYITQCGLTSEGIYRKSGQNSKTTGLLEMFRKDARKVRLKEGEHQVDDVANTLKRFFRDIRDGLFTREGSLDWLKTSALEDDGGKIGQYRRLLSRLPAVNKATVKALINHLYRVQCFSDVNQMTTHNLAIVFGPTLFQTDGKDYKAGRVVEDLIRCYVDIFSVDEDEMRKQQEEITAIMKMRIACSSSGTQHAGDFICTVYLEEKKTDAEQHIKIPATMTAEELTFEILNRRKIVMKEKDFWSCFEVNEREEAERPLHYTEKVLPILHCLGKESYLVVKRQLSMENMLVYLASRVGDSKHGMMKFREEKNLLGVGLSTGFHDRYFILNSSCLRLYKEVRSHKPEKEWPVNNLKVYLGVKKKVRPPTCWGFTVFFENEKLEKQQWYLCCDTQMELRAWFATFLSVQHSGNVWPSESSKIRVSRTQQDSRLGNISLIPLRGNESEMRNSVAAFAADPLTLFRDV